MFGERKLVIATKHEKERVIAPILESELGVICFVPDNFDSDAFGTFSGEVERKLDPVETAKRKCRLAMELNSCDLGVASEGSFGPHPSNFFARADDEILVFIDTANDLEIIARELTIETNFDGRTVANMSELLEFAEAAKFPSHGLILRSAKGVNEQIIKSIIDRAELEAGYTKLFETYGSAYVETDMRAMFNPTRLKVIGDAAVKLAARVKSLCPKCATHGFGVVEMRPGLRCSMCGAPTDSALSLVSRCKRCGFEADEMYPNGNTLEDPRFCGICNP